MSNQELDRNKPDPRNHQTEPTDSFHVSLVDNNVMSERWDEVEAALRTAFAGSEYIDEGYGIDNPINFTRAGVDGKLGQNMGHALATNGADRIIGGIFCIPTTRPANINETDVGWVFLIPDISPRTRLQVMDALVDTLATTLDTAGYQSVVTNMGTQAGADSLSIRYGITPAPIEGKPNRWVATLQGLNAAKQRKLTRRVPK